MIQGPSLGYIRSDIGKGREYACSRVMRKEMSGQHLLRSNLRRRHGSWDKIWPFTTRHLAILEQSLEGSVNSAIWCSREFPFPSLLLSSVDPWLLSCFLCFSLCLHLFFTIYKFIYDYILFVCLVSLYTI